MTAGGVESFCGSPLWDSNLTWYTETPQFTECFRSTVLVYIPVSIFILLLPIDIYSFYTSQYRTIPWNYRIILRLCLTISQTILSLTQFFLLYFSNSGKVHSADLVSPVVAALCFSGSFILLLAAKHFGQITSVTQFFYWLSFSFCQALSLISSVLSSSNPARGTVRHGYMVITDISFALGLALLLLNLFADPPPEYSELTRSMDNLPPSVSASLPSKIFFRWFDGLVHQGWKKPLTKDDLWNLTYEYSYKGIIPKFEKYLHMKENGKKSALGPLVKCFWSSVLYGASCQIMYIALGQANPQILNLIIAFVEERQEMWKGFFYVVLLALISILIGIFDSWTWNLMRKLSMKVMTALTAAVYKKSLVLSANARRDYTAGEIVNLIAVDCTKIEESVLYLNFLYTTPIQICVTVYFVWNYLGYAVLVGVGVLFALLPINMVSWHFMENYQRKQMKQKDIRVNLVNEVLNGIKVLKLYAWEKSFIEKLSEIRNLEISHLRKFQYLEATQFLIWNSSVFFVSLASFGTFVLIDPVNNILDAQTAFVSLTLIRTLREPLFMLPFGIINIIQGGVSLRRVNKFLNAEEINPDSVSHKPSKYPIEARNASFKWDKENGQEIINNVTVDIAQGSLVAVVGQVGAGKSSLVQAILGEMPKTRGSLNTVGTIAYVAQQAWIRHMSVKDNILFGKKLVKSVYDKVVEACALVDDFRMLPDEDATEIGEKGINLSGGQKQRINLARAVYSNRDVYLMDDPLSAVDSHVGKHIFDKVIGPKGLLSKKTRILVTHGINFLPFVDKIIVLKEGSIVEMGSYEELVNKKGNFADFIFEQLQKAEESEAGSENEETLELMQKTHGKDFEKKWKKEMTKKRKKKGKTDSLGSLSELSSVVDTASLTFSHNDEEKRSSYTEYKTLKFNKLIEEEFAELDSVSISIYSYYFKSGGPFIVLLSLLSYVIFEFGVVGENFWLSVWSDDPAASLDISVRNMYLIGYGVLGGIESAFIFLSIMFLTVAAIQASIKIHSNLVNHILRSPMSFFDTTPTGRIVNRFSKDTDEVDIMMPVYIKDFLNQFVNVLGTGFILSYVSPLMILVIVPMVVFFFCMQKIYLATSRQLKRIISISRSPINSHLEETLAGATTIRAFGFQERFCDENEDKIEDLQIGRFPEITSGSWLFQRLQLIGTVLVVASSLIIIINRDTIDPGLVGLSLSFALTCQIEIYMLVRLSGELEKSIVSVERVKEYTETPQEAAAELENDPPSTWPEFGQITFNQYSTRYRPGLDLVLKEITCKILGGEKIGIVGRTGAGKSSITLCLFRIIEAASGDITIDNVNIAQIGLTKLRSGLTIIPQDPVLFSGTLRFNLDPFDEHSDRDIWRALEMANLSETARKFKGGLSYVVSEGGSNLSVGQRQLLCLVRALLRKTKILILDEATAAVDLETDDLIQATIRQEFRHCTVLTIAHRLRTVLDNDRVMVMDKGTIKEFDTPTKLLKDRGSTFYSMARDAGVVN